MDEQYTETGGLRWGRSFWGGTNATWPFATLHAGHDEITIVLNVLGVMKETFRFSPDDLTAIRRQRGIFPFNTGVVFEHSVTSYPPFILFWTFQYHRLKTELNRLGFEVQKT